MNNSLLRGIPALGGMAAALLFSASALAQDAPPNGAPPGLTGEPHDWGLWHQLSGTPTAERLKEFDQLLTVLMVAIVVLVVLLLGYAVLRFNTRRNPTPRQTSHNTVLEVAWTVIPVVILVIIAVPSFKILFYIDTVPKADMTLKVIGHQWYWEYQYPDSGDLDINSYVVNDSDLKPGQKRLLDVDTPVVLPVDTTVRLLITGADVIHSWGIPSMGFTRDAVPGRLNETWTRFEQEGTYYGNCRELCGTNHAFMPVQVKVVSRQEFDQWVQKTKTAQENTGRAGTQVAQVP